MRYGTAVKKIGEPVTCAVCGTEFPEELKKPMTSSHKQPLQPTADHIIPKSKGGSDVASNIQWVCWQCNQIKGDEI